MAERRSDQSTFPGSTEINQTDHSIQIADISTLVSMDTIAAIPCDVRSSGHQESANSRQTESFPSLYFELEDNHGLSINSEDTFSTDGLSLDVSEDEASKTVDDIFAFINDSFHQGNELQTPFTSVEPANTSRRVTQDGLAQIGLTSSSERATESATAAVPPTSLTLPQPMSPTNWTLMNDNLVNFNRQCPIKESSPMKEMDIFLPEEKTIDLSLNTTSWKGRTPPTHIFDFEDQDLNFNRVELPKDKIPNQVMIAPRMTPHQISPKNEIEFRKRGNERMRKSSIEKIIETGKHISNIQVKHDRRSDRGQRPNDENLEIDKRAHRQVLADPASVSDMATVSFGQNSKQDHIRSDPPDTMSTPAVMDNVLPISTTGSINLSRSRPEVRKSLDKQFIVDLQEPRLKKKSDVVKDPTPDKVNNKRASSSRDNGPSTIKEIQERFQDSLNDTVDAKEEFNIFGLVTQANNHKPHSSGSTSTNAPKHIQVTVSTQEHIANSKPIMSRQSHSDNNRHENARRNRHSQLPKHTADNDNIKVFVNVNVNMNNSGVDRSSYGSKAPTHARDIDFSVPMINYQADVSDKSATNYMVSDDDFGSEFGSSLSDQDLPIAHLSNYPSVTSLDKMRMPNFLGPFGLSPIPSESCESDTTNRQVDSSSCEDGKMTSTMSEYSVASSDTTIKGLDSYTECSDKKPQKVASSKRQHIDDSTKLKTRKISFEEDESSQRRNSRDPHYQHRPSVIRSHSQPEQYLMDKRQGAINRMRLQMGHDIEFNSSSHKTLKLSTSEPLKEYSNRYLSHLQGDGQNYGPFHNPQQMSGVLSSEENDGSTKRISDLEDGTESTITTHEFSRYSWHYRSPFSSRVSRTSSHRSEGSRSGRRIRQLSVDIGEEWENVHPSDRRPRTVSDVGSMSSGAFSYRSLRKKRFTAEMLVGTDATTFRDIPSTDKPIKDQSQTTGILLKPEYFIPPNLQFTEEIESPGASFKEVTHQDPAHMVQVPKPVIIEVTEPIVDDFDTTPPAKRILLNNPYNSINQRFHSALHCPCLLFFCFLCCAPAVYWMQRSDYEFDYSSEKLAKRFGRRATGLYIAGLVMSILLFSGAIATTYILLQNELMKSSPN